MEKTTVWEGLHLPKAVLPVGMEYFNGLRYDDCENWLIDIGAATAILKHFLLLCSASNFVVLISYT